VTVIERKRGCSLGHLTGERFYILDLLVETLEFQFSGERFSGKEKLLTHRRTKVFGATWGELLFSNILANSLFFWDTAFAVDIWRENSWVIPVEAGRSSSLS
jgi:hypothetical protein